MRKDSPLPGDSVRPPRTSKRRSVSLTDAVMAGAGIGLAVAAALFPWYIFLNQEQFGPPAMRFEGGGGARPASGASPQPSLVGRPMATDDRPSFDLDFISTATPAPAGEVAEPLPLAEQPFPEVVEYTLVHVANGRAMVADDVGFWVVQPGSRLPDNSRVTAIEERDGAWVLVTSGDRVLRLAP